MDATYITEVRTAAGSSVATKYLARNDATRLGIIGAGKPGRSHVKALPLARPVEHVKVFEPSRESLETFMTFAERELPQLAKDAHPGALCVIRVRNCLSRCIGAEWSVTPGI